MTFPTKASRQDDGIKNIADVRRKKGFITQQEHEKDRRAKTITLTTNGEIVLQKAIIEVENAGLYFFAALDIDLSLFNKNMVKLIDRNKVQQHYFNA